jgi:hypothetical protein
MSEPALRRDVVLIRQPSPSELLAPEARGGVHKDAIYRCRPSTSLISTTREASKDSPDKTDCTTGSILMSPIH